MAVDNFWFHFWNQLILLVTIHDFEKDKSRFFIPTRTPTNPSGQSRFSAFRKRSIYVSFFETSMFVHQSHIYWKDSLVDPIGSSVFFFPVKKKPSREKNEFLPKKCPWNENRPREDFRQIPPVKKKISSREKIQKVCPWNSKSARENPDQKFAKRILDLILWWAC